MNQRLEALAAQVAAGRGAVARDAAHAQRRAFGREDAHDVVAFELPLDGGAPPGEDARGLARRTGRGGSGVEVQGPFGEALAAGDPLLDPRSGAGRRLETCAHDIAAREDQIGQDAVAAAVGDHDLDALARDARRDAAFGRHAPAAARGACGVDILREVAARSHAADDLRRGVRGRSVVDAVDVAQDDERLGVHHRGHEAREFVVVGEHQFGDRDGVVLVDDRDDARGEHRLHAVALVEVLAPRGEALLGGEHLPADDAVFVEEVVIAVQQLHLSDGREELARRNGVDASDPGFEDAAARGHGPRRDEDHLDARAVEPCDLVHERRDARGVGPSVFAGQHVAADLDDDAAVFFVTVQRFYKLNVKR